jgi:hypothetical protein
MDFPLKLRFKIMAISPQISVTDAAGQLLLYVKQKAFKLKETVTVFADEAQTRPLYHIAADRVLDISAKYNITAAEGGALLGTLQRQGMRSLWRAHYDVVRNGVPALTVREENPWVKVMDGIFGEIPVVGIFTGYLFHPAYLVSRPDTGEVVMRIVKKAAFLEGLYEIERKGDLHPEDEILAVLNLLMIVLLERRRG